MYTIYTFHDAIKWLKIGGIWYVNPKYHEMFKARFPETKLFTINCKMNSNNIS
jgi:hypothetical protein